MIRFITYLSPSLPMALYERVSSEVARALGLGAALVAETAFSGPPADGTDPFTSGDVDVGFLCAPSVAALGSAVVLVGAPVFTDPRTGRRPVYFADVIVRADSSAERLEDLRGGTWAYNDPRSLSGYLCLQKTLADRDLPTGFFPREIASGSHLASIEMVASGAADAAAVDSNVLALVAPRGVRCVDSWGPFPIQPVVARASLGRLAIGRLRAALLAAPPIPELGLAGFVAAHPADYERHEAAA